MEKNQVNMSSFESNASESSLQRFSLFREEGEDESGRAGALELVAAIGSLCQEWISPLAVSLYVESRDPANFYVADGGLPPNLPAWFLRKRDLDERLSVSPDWVSSQERQVEAIHDAQLRTFVEEALDQRPSAAHLETTFSSLTVNALAMVLPDDVELSLRYGGRSLNLALVRDRQRTLVLGPSDGPAAMPATLSASKEHTLTYLYFSLHWDLWVKHPGGRAQVRAAIERVLARGRGWQLEKGELP